MKIKEIIEKLCNHEISKTDAIEQIKVITDGLRKYEATGIIGASKIIEVDRNSINQLSFQTEKANKSELLELKEKLIKDIKEWKPTEGDAPDCFTMLYDYDVAFKKLNLPDVVQDPLIIKNQLK